jgi:hypothetical protein
MPGQAITRILFRQASLFDGDLAESAPDSSGSASEDVNSPSASASFIF